MIQRNIASQSKKNSGFIERGNLQGNGSDATVASIFLPEPCGDQKTVSVILVKIIERLFRCKF